jgi:hypothetical protein
MTGVVHRKTYALTASVPSAARQPDGVEMTMERVAALKRWIPFCTQRHCYDAGAASRDFERRYVMGRSSRIGIAAAVLLVSLVAAVGVKTVVLADDAEYAETPDGRTYGTLPTEGDHLAVADLPDLIAVKGNNGRNGYITRDAFMGGPPPSSPEEALRQQRKGGDVVVPVYAEDGVTVIDTFTIQGPNDGDLVQQSDSQ